MPARTDLVSILTAKKWAKKLAKTSKTIHPNNAWTLSQCQLAISQMLGYKHWYELQNTTSHIPLTLLSTSNILDQPLERQLQENQPQEMELASQSLEQWVEFFRPALQDENSSIHISKRSNFSTIFIRTNSALKTYKLNNETLTEALSAILSQTDLEPLNKENFSEDYKKGYLLNLFPEYNRGDISYFCSKTLPSGWDMAILLNKHNSKHSNKTGALRSLNLPTPLLVKLFQITQEKTGMFLFTGATGSGKTSFLKAFCSERLETGNPDKIFFIQKNAEISIPNALTFKKDDDTLNTVLSNILRSDPNIIIVDEITHKNDATSVIKTTESGFRTLTTLSCKQGNCIDTLKKNHDYPWEKIVTGWAHSKLVPLLCQSCSPLTGEGLMRRRGKGCSHCNKGVIGRQIFVELWEVKNEKPIQLFSMTEQYLNLIKNGKVESLDI